MVGAREPEMLVFEPQVLVVDFHHARGPEIQFWVTPEGEALSNHNDWSLLPFLALADGAHAVAEEFSYFTLLDQSQNAGTLQATSELPEASPAEAAQSSSEATKDDNPPAVRNEISHEIKTDAAIVSTTLDATEPNPGSTEHSTEGLKPKNTTSTLFKSGTTLFGIACTRQIRADALKVKDPEVTRSIVQKAVVVILQRPTSIGGVRERLGAVTGAWFGQHDFTNSDILKDFQDILKRDAELKLNGLEEQLGLSIREVLYEFRHQTLVMFKALLLQKKMLFFGSRCERLCLLQFALISLIPNLMGNLQDCADPVLDTYANTITRAASLKTSERESLLSYMGLPLQIFGESSFFSPYTPLQLLDLLMDASTHSFVVGSTNNLLLSHKDRYCDVLVNLDEESNKIQILNQDLRQALALSAADRRWIDHVVQGVLDTWDPANPSRPNTHAYASSEDAIRLQFEEYILSLLSSEAYKAYYETLPFFDTAQNIPETNYLDPATTSNDFNNDFLSIWRQAPNHGLFVRLTKNAGIFDIIEPKHPTAGGLNIEDVQRRLAQGMAEMHLDERVREGRETVGRVLGEGRERVGAGVARLWKGVEDFRQRRDANRLQDQAKSPTPGTNLDTSALRDDVSKAGSEAAITPADAGAKTPSSATITASTWASAIRDRASKVQIQRPSVDTQQISAAAKDNAAKAGQYLSSWGSWARERSKEWSEGRRPNNTTDHSPSPSPSPYPVPSPNQGPSLSTSPGLAQQKSPKQEDITK